MSLGEVSRYSSYGVARLQRSTSIETYHVRVYLGELSPSTDFTIVDALRNTLSEDIVRSAASKMRLGRSQQYELAETFFSSGQMMKERRLDPKENPVRIQLMWPKMTQTVADVHRTEYRFFLRKKEPLKKVGTWELCDSASSVDDFMNVFVSRTEHMEYPDLCNLPDLNETTLLDNLKLRFGNGHIYTYIGSILIAVNPFKYYPIYNPKHVRQYQNKRLMDNSPHIFAIADSAYHQMLREKKNQCVVISGESGSGKTESTNLLLSQLSALSQKGSGHSDGIEQTILGAGPVLEAFGNAKTVHNNNSSRFGKFIQVNYKENGVVHGAVVEKYLLEKSRLVHQAPSERNYHVFYYLLVGSSDEQKERLGITRPEDFHYLNQYAEFEESLCYYIEDTDGTIVDECHEFERLKQSMETVGFSKDIQQRIWHVLAAVLHLGNIEFDKKRHGGHHEAVQILNMHTVSKISSLLMVKQATLVDALTKRKTQAGGETVVMSLNLKNAIGTRDAMAKCLYSALFDWIVLQVNQALVSKREFSEHKGHSIGVLDIFGFEDFGSNSFEQFCINYANEHLQYYFNQHVFKYEQEEYVKEGIQWQNIEFIDNIGCLNLFSKRPTGLLFLLDEECNFPAASNDSLLSKFNSQHKTNEYYDTPQMREDAFFVVHYAGKVKYQIQDFREKNLDMMRHDVMVVLKNSSQAFVRELVGYDPVAMLRWSIVRVFFRSYFAFIDAGKRYRNRDQGSKYGSSIKKASESSARSNYANLNASTSDTPTRRHNRKLLIIEKSASVDNSDYDSVVRRSMTHERPSTHDLWDTSHLNAEEYKVMRRANRVLQKTKQYKPKTKTVKQLRDLQRMKTLSSKNPVGPRSSKGKNKPPSVSAQFNFSLQKLLETLNQSNPFFIRCIKSNMDKKPCKFDDSIVLRQLRYTGMLATVRIRQSGYNYRVTYQAFKQQYRILLPKGSCSTREDLEKFLSTMDLNQANYQIGTTKVFLREAEKMLLDNALHQAIITRITTLQHWLRGQLERQRYVRLRSASIVIQSGIRRYLAQTELQRLRCAFLAAVLIQKRFRGYARRKRLHQQREAIVCIQALARGYIVRKRVKARAVGARVPSDEIYDNAVPGKQPVIKSTESSDDEITREVFSHEADNLTEEITVDLSKNTSDFLVDKMASVEPWFGRSFSDSDSRNRENELELASDNTVQTRVLRRSTSHTPANQSLTLETSRDVIKKLYSYEISADESLENVTTDIQHLITDDTDIVRDITVMARNVSIEGEFEVPEPKSPVRTKLNQNQRQESNTRRVSASKATDLDAAIALSKTDFRSDRSSDSIWDSVLRPLDIPGLVRKSGDRTVEVSGDKEEDEWQTLEVEFKPQSPGMGEAINSPLAKHDSSRCEQFSPTTPSVSQPSFMYSAAERKHRYIVPSSESRDMSAEIEPSPTGKTRSSSYTESAKTYSTIEAQKVDIVSDIVGRKSKYVVEDTNEPVEKSGKSVEKSASSKSIDLTDHEPTTSQRVSERSTTSQRVSDSDVTTEKYSKGESASSAGRRRKDSKRKSAQEKAKDNSDIEMSAGNSSNINAWKCDVCEFVNATRRTCEMCGTTRSKHSQSASPTPPCSDSLLRENSPSTSSDDINKSRRSLRERQNSRSVIYIDKKVYGDEGLITPSSQNSDIQDESNSRDSKESRVSKESRDFKESRDSTDSKEFKDSPDWQKDSVNIQKVCKTSKESYIVQKESDNVCIVERNNMSPQHSDYVTTKTNYADIKTLRHDPTVITPDTVKPSHESRSAEPIRKFGGNAQPRSNTPKREGSYLSYTVKKKYDKNADPLQSEKKLKAASTSNLLSSLHRSTTRTKSSSNLEGKDSQLPDIMTRNTPARTPLKSSKRVGDKGSGDSALSASDDGSLNRMSSNEELDVPRAAGLLRPHRLDERSLGESFDSESQRSSRSSTGTGRRRSEDVTHSDTCIGLLPGEALDVHDSEPSSTHRRKYSDETARGYNASTPQLRLAEQSKAAQVSYNPSGNMNKSTSEEVLYAAQRSMSTKDRRKKRQSAPIVCAPLATQESLDAPVEDDPNVFTRHLLLDEDSNFVSFHMPEGEQAAEGMAVDVSSTTSPFTKTFKQLRNKFTGHKGRKKSAEELDDSDESGDDEPVKAAYPAPDRVREAWGEKEKAERVKEPATRSKKSPQRRTTKSKKHRRISKGEGGNTWSVSSTSQWKYPTKNVVKDSTELKQLTSFMFRKKTEWEKNAKRSDSVLEKVFNGAFNDFINNLMVQQSVSQESKVEMRYNILMLMFEKNFRSKASQETNTNPDEYLVMGINSFRSYLDEFYKKKINKELPDIPKIKKEKKRKKDKEKDMVVEIGGHMYTQVQLNIHTVCEMCGSRMWMVGYVCKVCHYAVHKKCAKNSAIKCKDYAAKVKSSHYGKVFEVPLGVLIGRDEPVPPFLETLFSSIEMQGIYTVGIYRKAGAAATVRQIEKDLNSDVNSVKFCEEPIHALASLLKKFLRDMPEPLMTFELYDDFIRGTEIEDLRERTQCLFALIEKLPHAHFIVLQRLMNHLARIAQHEADNKMTCSALAIVFGPTILRSGANLPAQESLSHVPKQSRCVQCIIEEQLRKIDRTLEDIRTLETATITAEERLSVNRASLRVSKFDEAGASGPGSLDPTAEEEEAAMLSEQIKTMRDEKEMLSDGMTRLECPASSSDEDLLTDDMASTGDEIDEPDPAMAGDFTLKTYSASPSAKRRNRGKYRRQTPVSKTAPDAPWAQSAEAAAQAETLTGRGLMTSEEVFL